MRSARWDAFARFLESSARTSTLYGVCALKKSLINITFNFTQNK